MRRQDSDTPLYVATCLYGLEGLLADEVRERFGAEPDRHWCEVVFQAPDESGRAPDGSGGLGQLRLAGNVFLRFAQFRVGRTKPDLDALRARLLELPLDRWEQECAQLQGPPGGDISVTVRRRGEHNYTYADVEALALDALAEATGRKTTLDPRPLELRVDINQESCRLMGRLTPTPLARRSYKRYTTSGETDPTLAAAMVRLARPPRQGSLLDPFCGSGAVPIEAALAGFVGRLVGGDDKPRRIECARANAEAAGAPVALAVWDAFALPFGDAAFDRVVTVPPQGDPETGGRWEAEKFTRLLAEAIRVLKFSGTTVWLMKHSSLFPTALKALPSVGRAQTLPCSWKGKQWTIYSVTKAL